MCYMTTRNRKDSQANGRRHTATLRDGVKREKSGTATDGAAAAAVYGAEATLTVGVRELRQNLSVYLDQVKEGRVFTVTEHGQQVAILRPLPTEGSLLDRLVAEGKASAPRRPLAERKPPLDIPLGTPLSQLVAEMRDEDHW